MSDTPTATDRIDTAERQAEDVQRQQDQTPDEAAQESVEKEDIEEEEQADVDRLEEIDAALTENGGP
ncbi:hypothetical protein [Aureimonas glaciei]|uniref:Uncharacterized protein n=1 Tax=Aureimonas glaciei TaxID=1776957 RepID=A0A916Y5F2_9HYPH|nr:hypothetical protein [Aureimonas glaciei]GGD31510.1 hypothetical protein GCM10011335_38180 [Aureimonas glaciei]